ncbi:MAG: Asp-tRNA(Asn)/Glu-tRNA(Gln) amidotransferase subunit GatB [Candidatus Pacebacteria bacterium]|nr:Asp-tRNA(Asn)/Glu-tRNA(Gln) amidotransferase subunit GatB [Candidatus Paceibacterota bacterium]
MSEYRPTIGLEIHVELKTQTKMFCDSKNDPDEKQPNTNICPVCMAHPGTLPTINRKAVEHVLRVGVALGGTLADYSEFDRKNYFYPDIPKGYQISQYAYPLVKGGALRANGHDVAITRIHLEEDTARSQHEGDHSLIDFNRAGVPLMELVTEPVIHDAKTAGDFGRELQLLLRTLGVSDADMEKGHLRVEVNISVSKDNTLGTKTEIKNINSFRAAEKAIEYEIVRQTAALEAGEEIVQETRGWDDAKGVTFSQRKKESSHDYRYFPDPDLPKMKISDVPEWSVERLRDTLPELPAQKRERLSALGLNKDQVELFVSDFSVGSYFDAVSQELKDEALIKSAGNYIAADLVGLVSDAASISVAPAMFAKLIRMTAEGTFSSRGAKDVLAVMVAEGGDAEEIAKRLGVVQENDIEAIRAIVKQIIDENPKVVEDIKGGKENLLQFLVGQGMKLSKGSANPKVLGDLIREELKQ